MHVCCTWYKLLTWPIPFNFAVANRMNNGTEWIDDSVRWYQVLFQVVSPSLHLLRSFFGSPQETCLFIRYYFLLGPCFVLLFKIWVKLCIFRNLFKGVYFAPSIKLVLPWSVKSSFCWLSNLVFSIYFTTYIICFENWYVGRCISTNGVQGFFVI